MNAFGKRELQTQESAADTKSAEAGWNRDLKKPSLQHKNLCCRDFLFHPHPNPPPVRGRELAGVRVR